MAVKEPKKCGRRYPWAKWFAKDRFRLKRGVDYPGRTDTMVQMIRQAAIRPHYNVSVRISVAEDGESLTVQVLPRS